MEVLALQGAPTCRGRQRPGQHALRQRRHNILDGTGGADNMAGGAGNDVYFVDDAGDFATENANEGNDMVFSNCPSAIVGKRGDTGAARHCRPAGAGNSLANTLYGNAGNNILDGDAGADTIFGGAGNDVSSSTMAAMVLPRTPMKAMTGLFERPYAIGGERGNAGAPRHCPPAEPATAW